MTAASHAFALPAHEHVVRPRRPSPRRLVGGLLALVAVLAVATVASTVEYLRLPAPTGTHAVGRTDVLLTDPSRAETRSTPGARRQVRVVAWYPSVPGSGTPSSYVPGYERLRDGLVQSGELGAGVVAGLALVRNHARADGRPADDGPWPVVVLSPGNATNVAFYGSLAEDLASHGYAVIGVDHPYQVAAVDLGSAGLAVYEGDRSADGIGAAAQRIDERVADIAFVLDRLRADAAGIAVLRNRLDLGRVGVAGHSNGGIAAAEACASDTRVAACVNIDGQNAGGPFAARPDPVAPAKPFLFLTKERALHPTIASLFEAAGSGAFRVVVPAAAHDTFSDGARFHPRLAPIDGVADHVLAIERGFVRAFLDRTLRGAPGSVFGDVTAGTDVFVEVYPLGGRPHLPG